MATRDYVLLMPKDTTIRTACEEARCREWANGWESHIDETTANGREQAAYIRQKSGRTFTERRSGAITVFRFAPHQRCFAEHRTRPAVFGIRGIGRLSGIRAWIDDIGEHVTRIEDARKKG